MAPILPTWTSPLLPLVDGTAKRARFSNRTNPLTQLERVEGLLAGAADVDITPPPGLPKAGYSSNAHDGRGFRSRLRARVLHLRSATGSIAIVQCDLLGGSSVLQHLVAAQIAAETDISLNGVMIGATHTHAGPGQFLGTDFYNRFASNRSGFDPAWTQFLVDRISAGVIAAVANRVPAQLAFGHAPVWELTRNRSLDPHVHNHSVEDKRQEQQRKYVAVNPDLEMLRVDTLSGDPLAAMVIFSVHGTGISQRFLEYHGDLWAYLVDELAHRIEVSSGCRAVVGAIEGTHADVAPAIRPGQAGPLEARRIGSGIGAEAHQLWERLGSELSSTTEISAGFREVDLDRDRTCEGVELPDRPAVGAALVAGAIENTTPVLWRVPPFRAGSPKRLGATSEQGAKWVLGSRWLQPALLPRHGFPRVLPIQIVRIGSTSIVGLPFEVTVEAGRRVTQSVTSASPSTERAIVTSVCNEYSGYVTTAEEYSRQFYEGGHTLYGPLTEAFLSAHAGQLAAELDGGQVQDALPTRSWDLALHRYLPLPAGAGPVREFTGAATFTDPTAAEDGHWSQEWLDVSPGDLNWHEPLVRVEESEGSVLSGSAEDWDTARHHGRPVTDESPDIEVVHLGAVEGTTGAHRYRVRWYDPIHRSNCRHRFVLVANRARAEVVSASFD